MNFNLSEFSVESAEAKFTIGDVVTIKIYDKDDVDVTPNSPDDECYPIGDGSIFRWDYSNLTIPTEYQKYLWTMINQSATERTDVDVFSAVEIKSTLMIPFDIDLSKKSIYKGDSFEPTFRIDSNISALKVQVEFSDGETSTSTIINKATANVVDGGDDQVLLVAEDVSGTFLIYRVFLSGDETATFDSRFVDIRITVTTPDNKTQTQVYKIGFFEKTAIGFDTNP